MVNNIKTIYKKIKNIYNLFFIVYNNYALLSSFISAHLINNYKDFCRINFTPNYSENKNSDLLKQIRSKPNMKTKNIRAYAVSYEDDASQGFEHLAYILSLDESESLFTNARMSGKVKFEDRAGRNFTLIRQNDGDFLIKKRHSWL